MDSKWKLWVSRVFTAIVTLALVATSAMKIGHVPKMVDGLRHAGIPDSAVIPIALLELFCLALYLVPRTTVLGAVLLTGYFGGAIVVHIIGGESVFPVILIGTWVWAGIYFRVPGLPALLPLRREALGGADGADRVETPGANRPAVSRAPWISRVVLAGATIVFSMIGLRYIVDPVHASAETGVRLGSALAFTATRVGSGAFPLGFAIFMLICLFSKRLLFAGVGLVSTVITTAILVRVVGLVADGPVSQSTRLFIPEGIMFVLSLSAIILEMRRRQPRTMKG
jgi:hypothetical protein